MKRLKMYETVQPLGATPLGETVNLYTGELGFSHADVSYEGTGPAIVLIRTSDSAQAFRSTGLSTMGNWSLSIPRIETLIHAAPSGTLGPPGGSWTVAPDSDPNRYKRCTHLARPMFNGSPLIPDEDAWQGIELVTEDGERQPILRRAAQNPVMPAMSLNGGQPLVFTAVTQQNWQIGCLDATANNETGEAFIAVSPDGTKYWLNHLVSTRTTTLFDDPYGAVVRQGRAFATMYVTRVEDRFGNWVTYSYDPTNRSQLSTIVASDGREVSLGWANGLIDTITVQPTGAQPRVWRYTYANNRLTDVELPDHSHWTLDLPIALSTPIGMPEPSCGLRTLSPTTYGSETTATVIHPSGLIGSFVMAATRHARSYVDGYCYTPSPEYSYEMVPPLFATQALQRKTLGGPGVATQTWTYAYSAPQGSTVEDACVANGTCVDTRWVDVTEPDGDRTRYTLSTRWGESEGKTLKVESFQGASILLRTETMIHAAADAGAWPTLVGSSMLDWRTNNAKLEAWTPMKQRTVIQQDTMFTWEVASDCGTGTSLCLDAFARPTKVTKTSVPVP